MTDMNDVTDVNDVTDMNDMTDVTDMPDMTDMRSQTMQTFADAIAPVPLETFVSEVWGRRSLYTPGTAAATAGLLTEAEFFAVAAQPSTVTKSVYRGLADEHREMWIPGRLAEDLYRAGTTICIADISSKVPRLAELARSLRNSLGFEGKAVFNCYLSGPGRGFNTHFDCQHTLIVQLHGRKTWYYGAQPATEHPSHNVLAEQLDDVGEREGEGSAELRAPGPEELVEQVLSPGDTLYMAPGTWHRASAVEPSLALTLTCIPTPLSSVIVDLLRARVERLPSARMDLPLQPPGLERVDSEAHTVVEQITEQLLAGLRDLGPAELRDAIEQRLVGR